MMLHICSGHIGPANLECTKIKILGRNRKQVKSEGTKLKTVKRVKPKCRTLNTQNCLFISHFFGCFLCWPKNLSFSVLTERERWPLLFSSRKFSAVLPVVYKKVST